MDEKSVGLSSNRPVVTTLVSLLWNPWHTQTTVKAQLTPSIDMFASLNVDHQGNEGYVYV